MTPSDDSAGTFDIRRPVGPAGPFVFASPHSGDRRPPDMRPAPGLTEASLSSAEDAGVDDLLTAAPGLGAPLIRARISRAYVDLNRAPDDLDPVLIADCPVEPGRAASAAKIAAGYGVIPRRTGDGLDLYDRRLSREEADARLRAVHHPYHAALVDLMQAAREHHGAAVLIDWHSMPSHAAAGLRGARGPDVVLGDRHGTACEARLTRRLRTLFEAAGWTVALNRPYAGGYTTQIWGRPAEGFHAVQIELNRGLYLDEATRTPSAGHGRCRSVIERAVKTLLDEGWPA